jgi:hypothetical protein
VIRGCCAQFASFATERDKPAAARGMLLPHDEGPVSLETGPPWESSLACVEAAVGSTGVPGSRLGQVDRMLSGMCHEAGKSMMKGGRGLTAS